MPFTLCMVRQPLAVTASICQSNKSGYYITIYSPIARSVVLRRNQTIVKLLGNIFIHIAARSRLSMTIVWLPSSREYLFGFNASVGHCLVLVRMLHYLRVSLPITIMQSHTHAMQRTHMYKAGTRRIKAKKLLSRRRQSQYNGKTMQKANTATFTDATPFEIHTPLMEHLLHTSHKGSINCRWSPCHTFNKISSQVISRLLYLKVAKKSHK